MGEGRKEKVIREFSAGGVVFRRKNGRVLWLVTKAAVLPKSFVPLHPPNTWRLPKGWLDDAGEGIPGPLASGDKKAKEEDLQKTALKEVKEEGGVEARIVNKVGTIKFFFNSTRGKVLKFVTFYLMEWVSDLPEGFHFETLEVASLPFDEAYKKLTYPTEKQVLKKAKEILDRGLQQNLI
ncbi:MAG: AP4A hydrolase [Candidatus Amesbacteria bacterium GW2011_GWA2_47_11b]|uniref:AP4A hydrolase n=1 Tax=Candidatus Amesbacteria bacterium GW2011_GWA2_47_11b TaxID=1618358 RepID=A0A0G1UIF4_9BACT|nr:MAG: AP4A hydrolase [Candidatus Amesbacteria bacterium GW2011_GWA2_47_11b]